MSETNPIIPENLVVQLIVRDLEGKRYVGTGCPINSQLILTSKHVVVIANQKTEGGIDLVWQQSTGEETQHLKINDDNVVLIPEHDIALLICKTPLKDNQQIELARSFPSNKDPYSSSGYPLALKDGDTFEVCPAHGEIHGGLQDKHLKLFSPLTMNESKDWSGLSGSPVIHDQTNCIVGVVTDKFKNVNELLDAASIPYLLRHVTKFLEAYEKHTPEELKQADQKKLEKELNLHLTRIFNEKNILPEQLCKYLPFTIKGTSNQIIQSLSGEKVSAYDALIAVQTLTEDKQEQLKGDDKSWQDYFFDVEQLCGWLLLKSIRSNWWSQHKTMVDEFLTNGGQFPFQLTEKSFIEVVISREVLKYAQYTTDSNGGIVPARERKSKPMMFDASSIEPIQETLLTPIYQDLRGRSYQLPNDINKAINNILITAKNKKKLRNAPLYYLVSKETMESLEEQTEWFPKAKSVWKGYLYFICLDLCESPLTTSNATDEDQADLLEAIAAILRIKDQLRKDRDYESHP